MVKPKRLATEVFADANVFDLKFPKKAIAAVKGIFIGTALFLNAIFLGAARLKFIVLLHKDEIDIFRSLG